ncbi:MAG: hypothetical protein KGY76_06815 [Candidatus Thermoplasmatota archaeon]|nr:hypothetical protein [Candidatus Thermoplasmatota archaeon]
MKEGIALCPPQGEIELEKEAVVLKIGGSCQKDGETLKKSVEKIERCLTKDIIPIIVISALHGLTDTLEDIGRNNIENQAGNEDEILAEGEILSARILHRILDHKGLESKCLRAEEDDFPIVLKRSDGTQKIDLSKTQSKIDSVVKPLVNREIIPIIPGFIGKTDDKKIKTLERGGSDTSAVVLGSALQLPEVVLLKDVPGILRCDPDIRESEELLEEIDVEKALQLGNNGSEVINPNALRYKRKNTKIRIVNFDNNEFFQEGTKIVGEFEVFKEIDISHPVSLVSLLTNGKKVQIDGYLESLRESDVKCLSRFESNDSYSFCVQEKKADDVVDNWQDEIREKDDDILIGLEDDLSILEIKFNYLPDVSRYIYKIQKEMIENSVEVLYTKFDSTRFTMVFKKEDLKKVKKVFEVVR